MDSSQEKGPVENWEWVLLLEDTMRAFDALKQACMGTQS